MCGICGVAYSEREHPVDPAMLAHMTLLLAHRGPDSDGFFLRPGIGLGFRRLSIIDLDTGDQPIDNEDRTLTLVCNGEIYNAVELRETLEAKGHMFRTRSDVETILHLYEEHGADLLPHLRGMFVFALWDSSRRRLMLAGDRLGIKPLYWAEFEGNLLFGSEMKSLLAANMIPKTLDPAALRDLFEFGYITAPRTLLRNIRRLLPGEYFIWQDGRLTRRSYWHPEFPVRGASDRGVSAKVWAESLREKLEETVSIHMRSDVPVGVWLSPGVDSSGVAALAVKASGGSPVHAFSIGFEDPDVDEIGTTPTLDRYPESRLIPHRVTFRNTDLDAYRDGLWHTEDPMTAGLELVRMRLSALTARYVKVVLTGEGADEVLGGYPWYAGDRLMRPLSHLPRSWRNALGAAPFLRRRWPGACHLLQCGPEMCRRRYRRLTCGPWVNGILPDLFSGDLWAEVEQTPKGALEPMRPEDFTSWHPFHQLQYYDMRVRLANSVVHTLDRGSMAHSVEARVPFLDHELISLCARMPPGVKLRGNTEKYVLRRALAPHLPHEITWRKKRGLSSPFRRWLRRDVPEFVRDAFSEEALRNKGYFSQKTVHDVMKRHQAGEPGNIRLLTGVLGVQIWEDVFSARVGAAKPHRRR